MHLPNASVIGVRDVAAAAPNHPTNHLINAMTALLHLGRAVYARTAMISSDGGAG